MSGFNVLSDVSQQLRSQFFQALDAAPGMDFSLTSAAANITLDAPQDDLAESVQASLYLYHIDLDKHLRGQRPLADRTRDDLFHNPPMPVQLRYLFTPTASSAETNLSILGRVLQHVHDHPTITSLNGTPMDDSRGAASPALRLRPDLLSLEQLTQLWNALSQPYRLSASFLVEVVAIDSGLAPRRAGRVNEVVRGTGLIPAEETR